jgi:AcrR family transcriptional regulator
VDPGTGVRTRQKLDREAVVDAALRIADAEGLEVVTIRRLAHELSVTPMALYWHFKDKDRLLAAVADRLWEETATGLDRALDGRAGIPPSPPSCRCGSSNVMPGSR